MKDKNVRKQDRDRIERSPCSTNTENEYEQRLNELDSAIHICIQQWQSESEKCYKLLKILCSSKIHLMERKLKDRKESERRETMVLSLCDAQLSNSECLVTSLHKFAFILQRLRQFPPKYTALHSLIASSTQLSSKKLLLTRTNEQIRQLLPMIWMLEREQAFRKSSLWDLAMTENQRLFTIISSAWQHGIYTDPAVIAQLYPFI